MCHGGRDVLLKKYLMSQVLEAEHGINYGRFHPGSQCDGKIENRAHSYKLQGDGSNHSVIAKTKIASFFYKVSVPA